MTNWEFPCTGPVEIDVDSWAAGSVVVACEPTSTVSVEVAGDIGRARYGAAAALERAAERLSQFADTDDLLSEVQVTFEDGHLFIRGPRGISFRRRRGLDLTIKAPVGSSCSVATASADLSCIGELSALSMRTASGDVTAELVTGDVTVHSASGDILLNRADGRVTVDTASGDLQASQLAGPTRIHTASGDIVITSCGSSVTAQTASGDVQIGAVASGHVELRSSSGDLHVGVLPGLAVYLDLASTSGSVRSDLDPADDSERESGDATVLIDCRTLSGDIRITRASGRAARQQPVSAQVARPEPPQPPAQPTVPGGQPTVSTEP
jgi:Putative adhesin